LKIKEHYNHLTA